ncbi:hypothetical protein PHSY_001185 [Pseudozyma hubeiensis SY62]|uniref:Uncharacterized protein n=1 Tax=Pseudozyma hubeiensis (strain SY62) TaxID=1305764 RepID=R9P677_PSEHS|nr:hypothetical protein PHSY_001185 [Pseudozyma hubeiensis SY62]GAC93620.1 hypothetical protein PHSY_001185 [Pseudozyma hubeiensis SY62]
MQLPLLRPPAQRCQVSQCVSACVCTSVALAQLLSRAVQYTCMEERPAMSSCISLCSQATNARFGFVGCSPIPKAKKSRRFRGRLRLCVSNFAVRFWLGDGPALVLLPSRKSQKSRTQAPKHAASKFVSADEARSLFLCVSLAERTRR